MPTMFSLLYIGILVAILLCRAKSQLQCANDASYCLTGLKVSDSNSAICSQYIHQGIHNNCSYFVAIHGTTYLLWDPQQSRWEISSDGLSGSTSAAYCTESILDDCGRSKWWYYNANLGSWYLNDNLAIKSCNYNNTDCMASYTENDTYCVGNTAIKTNAGIAGRHWFKGCLMNQPYYVESGADGETIAWDDILLAWYINEGTKSAAFHAAYCTQTNITECSQNWYVYDASADQTVLDDTVVSGYCDICLERTYDEICIIGGILPHGIIGKYEFEKCLDLFPSYTMIGSQSKYTIFHELYDQAMVSVGYQVPTKESNYIISARCNGSSWDACIGAVDEWYVYNAQSNGLVLQIGFEISDCSDVNSQCADTDDYCLDIYDGDDIEFGGVYKFEMCDENNYPIYYQYSNMNGNETDFSMISFDFASSQYQITTRNDTKEPQQQYSFCNGLSLDRCDEFWIPLSKNFSLYRCVDTNEKSENRSNNTKVLDIISTTEAATTKTAAITTKIAVIATKTESITTVLTTYPQNTMLYRISAYVVVGVVTIFPLLIILIAYWFHKKRIGSDNPGYMSIFKLFTSVGDLYTDAIWSLTLYSDRENNNVWFYAFVFTFGPHLLSVIIGLIFITKWRQTKGKLYIREYAIKYDTLVIISTLLSGFYATTEIITSHLFHVNALSLQITNEQRSRILNLKIINDVILENIPCLCIQYLYLQSTALDNNGINITLLAMIFSILAISFGVLTIGVRLFNGCIDMSRGDNLNQIDVEFSFKSSVPDIIKSYHIHTNYLLSEGISVALQMEISQIQITRIHTITDGIKINAKFKYLHNKDVKRILNGLKDDENVYKSLYKECTKRLKIESKNTTLNILHIYSKDQTKDDVKNTMNRIVDDNIDNFENQKRLIITTNNSPKIVRDFENATPSNPSIEMVNGDDEHY